MTISPVTRMTTRQKTVLNNMNYASQIVGGLGNRIDAIQYDSVPVVATGNIVGMRPISYSTTPAIGTATVTHSAITLTASPQTITTGFTQPDFPRILTIKGNASGNAGDVVVTGTDINDAVLTETIALNGATEVLGTKAFKTIVSALVPAETHAGTDTISLGRGNKVGFPVAINNTSLVIAKTFDGSVDSSTITVGATAALSLAAPAGTFNNAKIYTLVFLA